ncbi:MAG: sugar transferase [Lachnospiraceae bacterium]|nr:sugar transferase [Lachnospiraceae bacterium]
MERGKNNDQYKRTILFFQSVIIVALATAVFGFCWYEYYAHKMFFVTFFRRGNYAVIGTYFLVLFFFSNTYGGLKIGQLKPIEVVLSHFLSLFLSNIVAYIIVSLLAFGFVNPGVLMLGMLVQMVIVTVWDLMVIRIYNRVFQPWKMLLIYGDRPAADLVYKVSERRDKYAVHDAISINEGMEVISEKIKDFQAVIIGDISAVERNDLLKYCYANHIRAYVIPKLSDIVLMGADRIHVFDTPFLLTRGYALSFDERFLKRAMDIILSIPLIIILSPVMLITALVIKLTDRGPVFYTQIRCTKDEKEYKIIKFRSMVVNAEKDGEAVLSTVNDDRITPVGRFIRATRIDELPQLFNILKGEMSFVGPRPERPELIKTYKEEMPEFAFRNRVKAGLTGFAQVYGKYNTTPYDKLKLDLFYIENYSLWMDIKLILMTVKIVLKKESTEGIGEGEKNALKEAETRDVKEVVEELKEEEHK